VTGAGQRDAPLAARRVVPAMQIAAIQVVFEDESLGIEAGKKILRSFSLIEILEMGPAVGTGIDSTKLHGPSEINLSYVINSNCAFNSSCTRLRFTRW
jgi:hypothetical protein